MGARQREAANLLQDPAIPLIRLDYLPAAAVFDAGTVDSMEGPAEERLA